MLPTVGAFMQSSLIEWPGKIATVIALQGCNFRCPYCHSAPLVPKEGDEVIPFDAVLRQFGKLVGWLDGTVISGGEPLIHEDVRGLIERVRAEGLLVKLDTNGSFPDRLAEMIGDGLVEHVAMDLKAPLDAEKYSRAAGVNVRVEDIRRSTEILREWGASGGSYEFRTTLCPAVLTEDDVLAIAEEVADAPKWFLQQFRPMGCLDPAMLEVEPWSEDRVREVADRCRAVCAHCMVRGEDLASRAASAEAGA